MINKKQWQGSHNRSQGAPPNGKKKVLGGVNPKGENEEVGGKTTLYEVER